MASYYKVVLSTFLRLPILGKEGRDSDDEVTI